MKQPFRIIARTLACCVALASLAGCTQHQEGKILIQEKKDEQEKFVELTFFGYKADALNLVAIEDTLHGFMNENPDVNLQYEGVKGSAYWDAFGKRVETGYMDDLIMVDHDSVMELSAAGKLSDLSDIPGLENFNFRAKNQFTNRDGSVYFLPTCLSAYGLYVNYDLLEEHGQKVPETWEEFQAVCDYFVSRDIVPIIANNYASLHSLIVAKALYPYYQMEDTNAQMDRFNSGEDDLSEALRSGVEAVADMAARGWFDREEVLVTAQTSDDLALFLRGDRPFMITGAWASPRVASKEPGFSYGIHALPLLDDGGVLVIDVNTCVSVNAESKHVDEAKDFLAYLIQPDVIWRYCDSQSSYTPLIDNRMPSDETISPIAEYLTNGRTVIGSDYRLTVPVGAALNACVDRLLRGGDTQDAMDALSRRLAEQTGEGVNGNG